MPLDRKKGLCLPGHEQSPGTGSWCPVAAH